MVFGTTNVLTSLTITNGNSTTVAAGIYEQWHVDDQPMHAVGKCHNRLRSHGAGI